MELKKFNNNYLRTMAATVALVGAYALTGCSKESDQGPTQITTEQAPSTSPSPSASDSGNEFQVSGVTGGGNTVITIDPHAMQNNLGQMVSNRPQNFVPSPQDIPKLPNVSGSNINISKDFCNDPTLTDAIAKYSGSIENCTYDQDIQFDQEAYYAKSVTWNYTGQDGNSHFVNIGFYKNKPGYLDDNPGTGDPEYTMGGYICNENSDDDSLTIHCASKYGTVAYSTDISDPSLNPNKARMEAAIGLYEFTTN